MHGIVWLALVYMLDVFCFAFLLFQVVVWFHLFLVFVLFVVTSLHVC